MAQCATEPQVHAGLPREDSEERAAWEVSDEEEAEKRVQVVYKKGRQRRKGAVGAVQVGLGRERGWVGEGALVCLVWFGCG